MSRYILYAIIFLVLGFVTIGVAIGLYGYTLRGGPLAKATGQLPVVTSSDCITPLLPKINDPAGFAKAINDYISSTTPSSPLAGTGQAFVDAGIKNGVNPAWEVNIARKESTFGTHVPPGSNNSYGRTATSSQPNVSYNGRLWYRYDSFPASAEPQAEYLNAVYISQGLVTIEDATRKYAPPNENDYNQYVSNIKDWIGKVMALAGSAVSCTSN